MPSRVQPSQMHAAHLANSIAKHSKAGGDPVRLAALMAEAKRRGGETIASGPKMIGGADAKRRVFGGGW